MKLKTSKNRLEIREALLFAEDFKIIKLSDVQAVTFRTAEFNSFEELVYRYGESNLLKEGEKYTGYVAIWYAHNVELNYLNGSLSVRKSMNPLMLTDRLTREAFKNGSLLALKGSMYYVWNFIDACAFDASLRGKLITAMVNDGIAQDFNDEEVITLKVQLNRYGMRFDHFFDEVA